METQVTETNNTQLSFAFGNNQVEIFELNDVVFFNAKDVGACLSMGDSATRKAMASMDDAQCKLLKTNDFPDGNSNHIRKLNNAGEKFLTEDGVYEMVFQSRKPEARVFRKWVTSEVLPSIRKNGGYIHDTKLLVQTLLPGVPESTQTMFSQAFVDMRNTQERLLTENKQKQAQLDAQAPKMRVVKTMVDSKGFLTSTQLAAKIHYIRYAASLNLVLHKLGVVKKIGRDWVPTAAYNEMGIMDLKFAGVSIGEDGEMRDHFHSRWTPKGVAMISDLLLQDEITAYATKLKGLSSFSSKLVNKARRHFHEAATEFNDLW